MKELYSKLKNRIILMDDEKKYLFVTSVLTMCISVIIFHNHLLGKQLLVFNDPGNDTYNQYWPCILHVIQAIRNGTISAWDFGLGFGNDIYAVLGYYLDPFTIWLLLLPDKLVANGFVYIFIIKIMVSVIFAYKYFRIIGIDCRISMIVALIWGFNGYMMLWGQHYQFASFISLFTVSIYGLEMLIRHNNGKLFIISFACILLSPYFGFQGLIFILGYYYVRYIIDEDITLRGIIKYSWNLAWRGMICFGFAAFSFLPNVGVLSDSSRYSNAKTGFHFAFSRVGYIFQEYLKGLSNNILGARPHKDVFFNFSYYRCSIAIPLISLVFLLNYLFHEKDKKKRIIWISVAFFIILSLCTNAPTFVMNGFADVGYVRWGFMLTFLLVINAALGMQVVFVEMKKYDVILCTISTAAAIGLMAIAYMHAIKYATENLTQEHIFYSQHIVLIITILLVSYVLLLLFFYKDNKQLVFGVLIGMVCFELAWANYATENYGNPIKAEYLQNNQGYFDNSAKAVKYIQEQDNGLHRTEKKYRTNMGIEAIVQNYYGTFWHGQYSSGMYGLINTIGYLCDFNPNRTWSINDNPELEAVFGIKYMLSKEELDEEAYSFVNKVEDIYIYENKKCFSMIYAMNQFTTADDFIWLNSEEAAHVLYDSIVIDEDEVDADMLRRINEEGADNERVDAMVVNYTGSDITAEIHLDKPMIVNCSIPNTVGWSIYIDGVKQKKIATNLGFFGTFIDEGNHVIEVKYCSPYMIVGMTISAFTAIFIIVYSLLSFVFLKGIDVNEKQ